MEKIVTGLGDVDRRLLPIRLYVAGGAALHLYTGGRVSADIDCVFSRRVVINDDLEVSYRDPDGRARILYLDRNYNDTLGLLHENAYKDSRRLELPGLDGKVVEVRRAIVEDSTGDRFEDARKKVLGLKDRAEQKFEEAKEKRKTRMAELDKLFENKAAELKNKPIEKPRGVFDDD